MSKRGPRKSGGVGGAHSGAQKCEAKVEALQTKHPPSGLEPGPPILIGHMGGTPSLFLGPDPSHHPNQITRNKQ